MTELHIKPAPGMTVRDPDTYEPLAIDGEQKPRTGYWLRRLNEGDVLMVNVADNTTSAKGVK